MSQGQATKRNPSSSKKQKVRKNNNSSNAMPFKGPAMRGPSRPAPQRAGRGTNFSPFDMAPQARSRKSPTGASYNDGFDVSSKPERRLIRVEEFDELVSTVTGQIAFTISSFACNPGQAAVFPRLSKFAQLYEKYRWKRLEFYFQHDVSQFNAQGAAGLVILSGLYDAASSTPTSKAQVEVSEPHVICMPNQNSLLRFNLARLHPQGVPLYVRPAGLPGGADIKTYDAANAFITVQGMAGSGEVGELHVRGEVELIGDILDASTTSAPVNNQVTQFKSTSPEALTTTVALQTLMATTVTNGLPAVNTAGAIIPPAGNYLVSASGQFIFTGLATIAKILVQKNATPIDVGSNATFVSGQLTTVTLNDQCFITMNGTDNLALISTGTFSSGTASVSGQLILTAI